MLLGLHVKNLALIEEAEVELRDGLNILTGETGAGKSIIIGSLNLALGAKADKEHIRNGAEYALVELTFSLNEKQRKRLRELDIYPEEDGTLLLQRKITQGRSVCRVNGESVSAGQLKELSACLLDLYGQHEHQSLLKPARHKQLLDDYAGEAAAEVKEELAASYREYNRLCAEAQKAGLNESERKREEDLLSFEINELEEAALIPGEDEELERRYRKMTNAKRIRETVYLAGALTGYEEENSAGSAIGRAVRELKGSSGYDEELQPITEQLLEIDNLLNDFNRTLADYREGLEFDEEEFVRTEERLNVLNRLKGKYGGGIPELQALLEEKKERLLVLSDYEQFQASLQAKAAQAKERLVCFCAKLSEYRVNAAKILSKQLKNAMIDLNFMEVEFTISVVPDPAHISQDGYDQVEFLISTNPGEKLRPLQLVASGGELSRIMLAFKSVLADKDETDTLVFDEIDTGISGRTAWKVAEKLGQLSQSHQIICITHLPQIAAMADAHYLIEKKVRDGRTVTRISSLKEEEGLHELARLLGSESITETGLMNAKEMRQLAKKQK